MDDEAVFIPFVCVKVGSYCKPSTNVGRTPFVTLGRIMSAICAVAAQCGRSISGFNYISTRGNEVRVQ